ncbi:hypothetical protein JOF41_004179 [Saccharothrix coeruleofusca]|uniref:hypothetical protein n=1 Tax=Saccharothrix coeruleofusca TaxID=33919 RepID=UPI001AE678DE|nr:hypothetical protein [Saccharothrix coeruleofusca]MBP2338001.1 hypothetical protein [Saccharothrix coeruleofusca]
MIPAAEAWLAGEVEQHLEAYGSIGLHELPWLLNGSPFDLPAEALAELPRRVVGAAVARGRAALRTARWPDGQVLAGPLPLAVLADDDSWRVRDDGTYTTLVDFD